MPVVTGTQIYLFLVRSYSYVPVQTGTGTNPEIFSGGLRIEKCLQDSCGLMGQEVLMQKCVSLVVLKRVYHSLCLSVSADKKV